MLRIGQVESSATADGKYTDGSVAGGIAATRLRAAAFNAIQEELANIVESAGMTLDPDDVTQVLAALKNQFLSRVNPFADIKADGAAAVAEALSNLGLGNSATRNVGTTTGTVAAGDDPRIANAVQSTSPSLCTAWVNFNGVSPATIRSSFNISSVTRLSTGKYQINFASPMSNATYSSTLTMGDGSTVGGASAVVMLDTSTTTGNPIKDVNSITILLRGGGGVYDSSEVNAVFFGGK